MSESWVLGVWRGRADVLAFQRVSPERLVPGRASFVVYTEPKPYLKSGSRQVFSLSRVPSDVAERKAMTTGTSPVMISPTP